MTDPSAMTDAPAAAPEAAPVAGAETTAPAEAPKPSGKSPFEIKKWSPVFMWSWDVESDTCSICRGNLNELCLECQTKPTNGECTIAWGVCNHAFHFHCISQWLKQRKNCPLDNTEWEYQKVSK